MSKGNQSGKQAASREERLRRALKDNLRKRKSQARSRADRDGDTGDTDGQTGEEKDRHG